MGATYFQDLRSVRAWLKRYVELRTTYNGYLSRCSDRYWWIFCDPSPPCRMIVSWTILRGNPAGT
jgi:hypothetical protein